MIVRTLRQQLFRSHLLVIVVVVGALVIGSSLLGGVGFADSHTAGNDLTGTDGHRNEGGGLAVIGVVGSAFLAAAFVGWYVARRIARPLEEIGRATKRLAAGDYDIRVSGATTAELDRLADDVNELADKLATTEERRLHLIGDVAHELRTPLSTIAGSMEALMDGVIPATDDTFADIARETARLHRLAGDLSALSASSELVTITTTERIDLGELAAEVVELLTPQAEAKDLDLTLLRSPGCIVDGDRDRLVQVLTNVIGNAIQYTDDGSVGVSVERDDSHVTVTVSDDGRGLAEEDLDRVFERFYRVDEQLTDGTGIGLTIAKALTRAHRGVLTAESEGLGRGSKFTLRLPVVASKVVDT